jgi:predicted unusual protein kinase regulating ubiquinone biosynthesis (AarF/ABC1/UbiB family)
MKKAGSVGEVYQAALPAGAEIRYFNETGEEVSETLKAPLKVAIKILTPARQKRLKDNLKILRTVAEDLKKHAARFGLRFDPVKVFEDFERTFVQELDFRNELKNAARYAPRLPQGLKIPRYFSNLSGENILVTEWVEGKPLDQLEDPALRQRVFDLFGHMTASHVLESGLYYEDPHPENILVTEGGDPFLIDLGRLGVLDTKRRENLIRFFGAVLESDPSKAEAALLALTVPGQKPQKAELGRTIRGVFAKNGHGFSGLFHTSDELFKAAFESGFYVHPEYTQMLKAFLTLEGVAAEDPSLGHFDIAKYLSAPFLRAHQALPSESKNP